MASKGLENCSKIHYESLQFLSDRDLQDKIGIMMKFFFSNALVDNTPKCQNCGIVGARCEIASGLEDAPIIFILFNISSDN